MEKHNTKLCTELSTASSLPELNDHCLMHIFSYLPIMDRIRVQRVCKRWREVGSLPWWDMKELDFEWDTWTTPPRRFRVSEAILRQVFQLCGIHLTNLSIVTRDTNIKLVVNEAFVALLKKYCPNIRILDLNCVMNRQNVLEYFAKYFNSISDFGLYLTSSRDCVNDGLESFFQCNRHLRSVTLGVVTLGRCLRSLPFENIEELVIKFSHILDHTFYAAIEQLPQLKTFEFVANKCQHFNDLLRSIIVKSNLKKLKIEHDQPESLNLKTITHLGSLEILDLSDDILHDDLLICVSENCMNLTSVSLGYSDKITDASLIPVLGLPNLQYVSLMKLPKITNNSILTKMPKLKSLKFLEIELLKNSGLEAVMESSKNIECIQVSRCLKISRETLVKDATRITENRKSNVRLLLVTSQVTEKRSVINVSPYLQIMGYEEPTTGR